jgi:hypothetical protein
MMPFEMLTEIDREKIQKYVFNYGHLGQTIPALGDYRDVNLERGLAAWNKSKEELFHIFGDQLILKKNITLPKPQNILIDEMWMALYQDVENPMYKFKYALDNAIATKNLGLFGYPDEISHYWLKERCLCNIKQLVENEFTEYPKTIVSFNDKRIVIQPGQKITKILKMLAEFYDLEEEYEAFRIEHSLLLNQKELHGELCFSIHPLDYMTMSDNQSGWNSCMSWRDNGCYHGGTVEMMNSECVVVAYLSASKNAEFGYFGGPIVWNNKKWRQLIIVDPKRLITTIKAYPYYSEELSSLCRDWAIELLGWENETYTTGFVTEDEYNDNEGIKINDTNIYFETDIMYNDFGCTNHFYAIRKDWFEDIARYGGYSYCYSGEYRCVCCGASIMDDCDDRDECMTICLSCSGEEKVYCEECDSNITHSSQYEGPDGQVMCESCYCDLCVEDFVTRTPLYKKEAISCVMIPSQSVIDHIVEKGINENCDIARLVNRLAWSNGIIYFQSNENNEFPRDYYEGMAAYNRTFVKPEPRCVMIDNKPLYYYLSEDMTEEKRSWWFEIDPIWINRRTQRTIDEIAELLN